MLGFPLGGLAAWLAVGGVDTPVKALAAGLIAGAAIGMAQWLALRSALELPIWWVAMTSVGMAAGLAIAGAILGTGYDGGALLWRGAIVGICVGAAQAMVLQVSAGAMAASVWAVATTIGWSLGWAVTRAAGVDLSLNFAVFGATGALAFQALLALVLGYLRHT